LGRCDATLRAWHTQSRCATNVKLCMHGGGLPCHHHCNFKPWAHRTTMSGTTTLHGRCGRVAERVHDATTTPPIANTQPHTNQTENAAHANKTYCMLTNHPPPWHCARAMSRTFLCRICSQIFPSQTSL